MSRWLPRVVLALVVAIGVLVVALVILSGRHPGVAAATPTPTPGFDQELLTNRVTFLVIGTDQNSQRKTRGETPLTDSMVVVSINATHTKMTMISVPRDSVGIPLQTGGTWRSKLNSLYSQKGMDALRGALDTLLGAKIDFTLLVNMDDFAQVVDAFGGIDVTVPTTIVDPSIGLRITAGKHHLDGKQALLYCRSRHTTNDFDRAARQQLVLRALLARFVAPSVKIDIPKLVLSLGSLQTDIGADKLPTLAELARRSRAAVVTDEVLTPPRFYVVDSDPSLGYVLRPKLATIRDFAEPLLTGP